MLSYLPCKEAPAMAIGGAVMAYVMDVETAFSGVRIFNWSPGPYTHFALAGIVGQAAANQSASQTRRIVPQTGEDVKVYMCAAAWGVLGGAIAKALPYNLKVMRS